MNGTVMLEAVGFVDESLIAEADCEPVKRRKRSIGWVAAAACVCILAGVLLIPRVFGGPGNGQQAGQSEGSAAADYFKNCVAPDGSGVSSDMATMIAPFADTRSFDDQREALEAEGVIPDMPEHPLFSAQGEYMEDGSLYAARLSWHRRGSMDDYSDLTVIAAPQPVREASDVVVVDENGLPLSDAVTVTVRDGISVEAALEPGGGKYLTWERDGVWTRVAGSWNDSYEDVVALLDWFWDHPIDLSRFGMYRGSVITWIGADELPPEAAACVPDLEALGYLLTDGNGALENGSFLWFEGAYAAGLAPGQVLYGYEGPEIRRIWWRVDARPDAYELAEAEYELSELTEETVRSAFEASQHITFRWNGYCVRLYLGSDTPDGEAWRILSAIRS